jgi:putative SOS response-associated peptidase YedK
MCGRYTLTYQDLGEVVAELGAILDPAAAALHHPRFNIAPTNAAIIACPRGDAPVIVPGTWGLRLGGRLVINVRGETAPARMAAAWARGRCVVPADGFYEWTGAKGERRPLRFHAPDGRPLLMAGLFEAQEGAPPAFAVLTTAARAPVAAVHDRMPLLLSPASARAWLSGPPRALRPDEVALSSTEASPRVNAVANDDPGLLEATPVEKRGQLPLF